jgi:hypothetical protein
VEMTQVCMYACMYACKRAWRHGFGDDSGMHVCMSAYMYAGSAYTCKHTHMYTCKNSGSGGICQVTDARLLTCTHTKTQVLDVFAKWLMHYYLHEQTPAAVTATHGPSEYFHVLVNGLGMTIGCLELSARDPVLNALGLDEHNGASEQVCSAHQRTLTVLYNISRVALHERAVWEGDVEAHGMHVFVRLYIFVAWLYVALWLLRAALEQHSLYGRMMLRHMVCMRIYIYIYMCVCVCLCVCVCVCMYMYIVWW